MRHPGHVEGAGTNQLPCSSLSPKRRLSGNACGAERLVGALCRPSLLGKLGADRWIAPLAARGSGGCSNLVESTKETSRDHLSKGKLEQEHILFSLQMLRLSQVGHGSNPPVGGLFWTCQHLFTPRFHVGSEPFRWDLQTLQSSFETLRLGSLWSQCSGVHQMEFYVGKGHLCLCRTSGRRVRVQFISPFDVRLRLRQQRGSSGDPIGWSQQLVQGGLAIGATQWCRCLVKDPESIYFAVCSMIICCGQTVISSQKMMASYGKNMWAMGRFPWKMLDWPSQQWNFGDGMIGGCKNPQDVPVGWGRGLNT